MKHKSWFRLILKAIGIVTLIFALPQILSIALALICWWADLPVAGGGSIEMWLWNWPYYLGAAVQCVIGAYLLFGGKWLVDRCIPSNRPYCPECGYDLSQSLGDRCAECGVKLPADVVQAAQRGSGSTSSQP